MSNSTTSSPTPSPPPSRITRSQTTPKKKGKSPKTPNKRQRLDDSPVKNEGGGRSMRCDRSVCVPDDIKCCLAIAQSCANKIDSENVRWIHISVGEHYCNSCAEHITKGNTDMYTCFSNWRTRWIELCRRDPTSRTFVGAELLPYWFRCNLCKKWRDIPAQTECDENYEANFTCKKYHDLKSEVTDQSIKSDEIEEYCDLFKVDERTLGVGEAWIGSLAVPGLLRDTPANVFLNDEYFNDEVGMSPRQNFVAPQRDEQVVELLQPFYVPTETGKGLCLRPDVMEYDEIIQFPQYTTEQCMFLGLRNLVIALWNFNPKDWLTPLEASHYILCRGLVRIHLVNEIERIVRFLTVRGVINHGILPREVPFAMWDDAKETKIEKLRVVVIGAGISGLCAANQLKQFGVNKLIVLEACDRLGGRCRDDDSLGVSVGCGAQLLTGVINNPIIVMCLQKDVKFRPLTEHCPVFDAKHGKEASKACDERVDFHFNCCLDAVENWRKTAKQDVGLESQISLMHNLFLSQSKLKWSDEEERIMQFQLGNLEFSCGACLDDVSSVQWDQNETFAQFTGDHALLTEGSGRLLQELSEGIDVRLNHTVKKIDYSDPNKPIAVTCRNGKRVLADKVLITMPLAVLQLTDIFCPKLPDNKRSAIQSLGAGIIEKVAVKFPTQFWSSKTKNADYFGHIALKKTDRGLFNMFYDFSKDSDANNPAYVLMSYVCGDAVDIVNEHTDEEVVEMFIDTLKKLFPQEEIPEPIGYIVTHWARDPYFGMSYSYVRKGASGHHYDLMAMPVHDRLYFAGEATNRYFPQTMTGAYLTGLREAAKIAAHATK